MKFSTVTAALELALVGTGVVSALPQNKRTNRGNYEPHKTTSYPARQPTPTHYVKVGGKDAQGGAVLRYDPEVVYADAGETIVFDFLFANHTVTESTFEHPCENKAGYDVLATGFRPNLVRRRPHCSV